MKQRVLIFVTLLCVLILMLTMTSCTSGKNPEKSQAGKANKQKMTATFPEKTFIDDREVRFAVREVTYPTALPVLSAKAEGFTDDELTGWFTEGGGKAEPKVDERYPLRFGHSPEDGVTPCEAENTPKNLPKMWEITGEETGTLIREDNDAIMFLNPNEYRSYGALPKGNIANPNAKIIFARDMITEKEAVRGAEAYIESHGGLPVDIKRKIIPGMSGLRIVKDGELVDPVDRTLWYSIIYTHRFENVPIEPDKIEVDIDALGIARYEKTWHEVQKSGKPRHIVSPEEAVEAAVTRYGHKAWPRYGIVVSQVRLLYQDTDLSINTGAVREFRPVWFIRFTSQEVLVDAHTGEAIDQPWESPWQRESAKAMKILEANPLSNKIPVPVSIVFVDGNREIWWLRPTDAEFETIFMEAQKILSRMRPYYKKQADQHGASSDTPYTRAEGGIRLDYYGWPRFTTDSKVGRDIDEKDLPKDEKERRLNYSEDGYYRIYTQSIFICFNKSSSTPGAQPEAWGQDPGGGPRTKILASTTGSGYWFTYSLAPNDKLIEMTYNRSEYLKSLLKSQP